MEELLKRILSGLIGIAGPGAWFYMSGSDARFRALMFAGGVLAGLAAHPWARRPALQHRTLLVGIAVLAGSAVGPALGGYGHLEDTAMAAMPLAVGMATLWWAIAGYRYDRAT